MFSKRGKEIIDARTQRASGASLVIESSDGRVLIVKTHYKPYWSFPGGFIDSGETPKQAAIREAYEEVGIAIDPETVEFLFVADRKSSIAQTYHFVFRATVDPSRYQDVTLQKHEIADYVVTTREDVRENYDGDMIQFWAEGKTGYIEHEL